MLPFWLRVLKFGYNAIKTRFNCTRIRATHQQVIAINGSNIDFKICSTSHLLHGFFEGNRIHAWKQMIGGLSVETEGED